MSNNYDNKNIRFTGNPVAFDGVEGKRDPKTGKGRFDLIPTEVFYPLFSKADHDWLLDCHPASILMSIADEKFIDAIIKMTIYSYAEYNEHYATSTSEFWNGVWPMLQDLAIHFQKGAEHYGERNCQKGIPLWSFKDSAMRHATQVFEGKKDEPHSISVIWNCWLAAWTVITSNKKDDTNKSDKTSVDMTLKILRDRRKEAKKDSYALNEDIDGLKELINELSKLSNELDIPIVTAQQTSYTREEVEAIKKEAAEQAIKDFLSDKRNIRRAINGFGSVNVIDELREFALDDHRIFERLLSTPEGRERGIIWYSPTYLFNELIERVTEKQGQCDYHDFVPLLLQLNSAYTEFLNNAES